MRDLNLYTCRRWSKDDCDYPSYRGALLITAESEKEASLIFECKEKEKPHEIEKAPTIMRITGSMEGIIYDDYCR